MLTLNECEIKIERRIFETPCNKKANDTLIRLRPILSEQSRKHQKNNQRFTRISHTRQCQNRVNSQIKRRILTAGGKRRFPKDFFEQQQSYQCQNITDTDQAEEKIKDTLPLHNLRKVKTQAEQVERQQQETPKFVRSANILQNPFPINEFMVCNQSPASIQEQSYVFEKKSFPCRKPLSIVKKVQKIQYLKQKTNIHGNNMKNTQNQLTFPKLNSK